MNECDEWRFINMMFGDISVFTRCFMKTVSPVTCLPEILSIQNTCSLPVTVHHISMSLITFYLWNQTCDCCCDHTATLSLISLSLIIISLTETRLQILFFICFIRKKFNKRLFRAVPTVCLSANRNHSVTNLDCDWIRCRTETASSSSQSLFLQRIKRERKKEKKKERKKQTKKQRKKCNSDQCFAHTSQ